MFTLVTDRSKFYRVKRGQSARDIENLFEIPVKFPAFSGMILELGDLYYTRYIADVGDTYNTIAEKFNVNPALLEEVNGEKPVYPTRKIFVPYKPVGNTARRDI